MVQAKENPFVIQDVGPRWVQVDLDAIRHNVTTIKSMLPPETLLMAVVKADAYGCGAVDVSRAVVAAGADMLGVTTVDEGVELRRKGIEAPILVFAPLSPGEAAIAARQELTVTVDSLEALDSVYSGLGMPVKAHLKVNTGMNRFGMAPFEVIDCVRKAAEIPGLEVEGIYSHLAATADTNKGFVEKQCAVFLEVIRSLEEQGLQIPVKHICNSAGFLDMPQMHLDMVRIGNLLYGQYPFGSGRKKDLKDPWTAHARILHVREVLPGEAVGYGCDFKARKKTRVGIIPVGFADGLDVAPQFKPKNAGDLLRMLAKTVLSYFGRRVGTPLVTKEGTPLPLVGRIGMQVAAVDLSGMEHIRQGDTVEVFLRRTTASSRLPRLYLSGGKILSVRTASEYRDFRGEYYS